MILEHLDLVPFGPMRPGNQAKLGSSLADLHLSKASVRHTVARMSADHEDSLSAREIMAAQQADVVSV